MKNLQFHYLVLFDRDGWRIDTATESQLMPDGTVYDEDNLCWMTPEGEAEDLDLNQFRLLKFALRQLNNGRIAELVD